LKNSFDKQKKNSTDFSHVQMELQLNDFNFCVCTRFYTKNENNLNDFIIWLEQVLSFTENISIYVAIAINLDTINSLERLRQLKIEVR
jgi:hypothetical protein